MSRPRDDAGADTATEASACRPVRLSCCQSGFVTTSPLTSLLPLIEHRDPRSVSRIDVNPYAAELICPRSSDLHFRRSGHSDYGETGGNDNRSVSAETQE
jgi:hypothetical protein